MKIHFSNVNFSSNSGPNSFASRLAQELTIQGHEIVDERSAYESFLIFIEPSSRPHPGARVVHRLDGIWFKPEQFHSHNQMIKWSYDHSDCVIWQSNFDRKMTTHHWGSKPGEVIHNGIDLNRSVITDNGLIAIRKEYEEVFVCSANWHRQKRLKENTNLFLELKKKYPKSCLIVMGSTPDFTVEHDDIFYTGAIPHDLCLEIFAMSDWLIHLAWLDHCPNVVVEALSQNCSVICTDSGGTKEIVKNNGIIVPENRPYAFELTDYDNPYELSVSSLELPKIEIDNSYLDIKKVAQKYISVLKRPS